MKELAKVASEALTVGHLVVGLVGAYAGHLLSKLKADAAKLKEDASKGLAAVEKAASDVKKDL